MTLALLFPGQGTQHPAMLGWLDAQPEAQPTLALMARMLGDDDWRMRVADADWASRNVNAPKFEAGSCVMSRFVGVIPLVTWTVSISPNAPESSTVSYPLPTPHT